MPDYEVTLLEKKKIAEGTLAFTLERPSGFTFKAGQSADLTLLNPPETDAEGNVRTFSIVSAPSEYDLTFATRLRDTAFKRVLRNMSAGTIIKLNGPMGSFNLHRNTSKPAVFLAGGIGITAFMSMIHEAAFTESPHHLYLFYCDRRPEDTAFLDGLKAMERRDPKFHLIATMTEMEKSKQSWKGERGLIDSAMLKRHMPGLHGPIYYIAGPPGIVAAMRDTLTKAGIDEDDIRTEDFAGY